MFWPAHGSVGSTPGTSTEKSTKCVLVGNKSVLFVMVIAATVTMLLAASR